MSVEELKNKINKKSQLNLQTEEGRFLKGDNETVDAVEWIKGLSADQANSDGTVTIVEITDVINPSPKSIAEARGLITADYQNYLETQWIIKLKEKYEVVIYKDVLETVK
jgi:peptidyl-prolyl cis-trans isomerase SurA